DIMSSENPLGMVAAVENTLKAHKPLIVIDGSIQADVAARFVTRCVTDLPIIITSETKLEGAWSATALEKLEPETGSALFKQEARLTTDEHDTDAYGLAKTVDYTPLGIVVTARAMIAAKKTPGEFLKLMQQVATATGGNSPTAGITTSFRTLTG